MRIVVAGAHGFLGSHIVEEAARHDVEVVALIPPDSDPTWFSDLGALATPCDSNDPDALRQALPGLLAGAQFLINAPALLADADSVQTGLRANIDSNIDSNSDSNSDANTDANTDADPNIDVTTALLDAALESALEPGTEAQLKGVVQLSSTLTYGHSLPNWAVDESWAARPPTPAMQSLAAAERIARTYRRRLPLLVLRAAPTFGPRDDGVVQRLLDHFGRAAHPRLAAAGRAPVSLAYGPDFARAAWAALQSFEETQGRILHVKSIDSDWRTVVAQARALGERSGRAWPLPLWLARRMERAGGAGRRLLDAPDGVPAYADLIGRPHLIDDTQLRALTGFTPLFGLRAALRHTIALQSQGALQSEPP